MAANNSVVLIGRVGNDVREDIKHFDSGSVKAEVRLAVNRTRKDEMGNSITDWFNCQFWGRQAETLGEFVQKGDLISISGSLRVDQWESPTGEKRSKVFVSGENFQMLESRAKKEERRASGNPMGYSQPAPVAAAVSSKPIDAFEGDLPAIDDDELPPF